jgi:SSS family solute:Na+ symporter
VDIHPIDGALIALYLGAMVIMGVRMRRQVRDAHDFFLAGRSLTWVVIGLSIIGTNVSAEGYVGASGGAWQVGIAQANFEWIGAIPAMVIAALVFIPLYWRAGVYSIPEYLGLRYAPSVRVVAALITSVFSIFATGVALWAIALTLETYTGLPIPFGIVVMGAVVGIYSISGGLRAIAFTDAVQVAIMFLAGLVVVWIGLRETGGLAGFAAALERANPTHLQAFLPADHPDFPWPGVLLGLAVVLSPAYWCGSQSILQRTLGARTAWDASAAMMFAAFGKTLVPLLIIFPGLLALVLAAELRYPDMALPWVVKHLLPPGLSGLMFIALIAALQSTIDSAINSTALMIVRDIRGVLGRRTVPDGARDLVLGRRISIAILLGAMAFAPFVGHFGGIYQLIQTLLSLFQGPLFALLLMGALTRSATPRAGLVALVTGVVLSAALLGFGINMLYVAFLSFCYALVVIAGVSRLTPPLPATALDRLTYRRGSAVTDQAAPGPAK